MNHLFKLVSSIISILVILSLPACYASPTATASLANTPEQSAIASAIASTSAALETPNPSPSPTVEVTPTPTPTPEVTSPGEKLSEYDQRISGIYDQKLKEIGCKPELMVLGRRLLNAWDNSVNFNQNGDENPNLSKWQNNISRVDLENFLKQERDWMHYMMVIYLSVLLLILLRRWLSVSKIQLMS
jgi:hypothetical protein